MIHHRPASTYHNDSSWPHLELGPGDDRIAPYGSFDAYLGSYDDPEERIQDLEQRLAGFGDYSAWWFMQ